MKIAPEIFMAGTIIIIVYMGFAGFWGTLLTLPGKKWLALFYGACLLLPASLGLPFAWPWSLLIYGMAAWIATCFAIRPGFLPVWIFSQKFLWIYLGTVTLFITIWGLVFTPANLGISLAAGLASILLFWRVFRKTDTRSGRAPARL